MKRNLPVRPDRIEGDIDALAVITEPDRPWTRRAFSPLYLKGRDYLARRFREAGLEVRIDAAGNLIGRRPGKAGKGTIMLGSHSDTVPAGGRFDGIAGVVAALEVARALDEAGVTLEHDLEIVDFLAEEVSVFGVSCIGSRGMIGARPSDWLAREADGMTLADGIRRVGGDPAGAGGRADIAAFLELHIEQGPVLETERIDIGVVTAIAGITRIEIRLDGRADHAGTTPMGARRDALAAAARIVQGIEAAATELAQGPSHFVATVGEFLIEPNAANVVPSHVRMLIDARAEDPGAMLEFRDRVAASCAATSERTGVELASLSVISDNPVTPMAPLCVEALETAAAAVGATTRRMVSGAGHDAAFLARVAPAAMVFIPCSGGRSHAPEEWADIADIALGAATLYNAVILIDRQPARDSAENTDHIR